jgi:hypothetical protein
MATHKNKLILYFKDLMVQLACQPALDPRDYYREDQQSRLYDSLKKNKYCMDDAFNTVIDSLLAEPMYIAFYETIGNFRDKIASLDDEIQENDKDALSEEIFDFKVNFINYIISYVGLFMFFTLHADSTDELEDKLFREVYSLHFDFF